MFGHNGACTPSVTASHTLSGRAALSVREGYRAEGPQGDASHPEGKTSCIVGDSGFFRESHTMPDKTDVLRQDL